MVLDSPEDTTDDELDYQIGQHDAESGGVDLGEGSEFLPWDLEVQTAIKRLAIDIYSSDESGVGEPLTNGTATLIEAVEESHLLSIKDGAVIFELQETPIEEDLLNDPEYDGPSEELELTISDNGMGMTEKTVRKVLRVLGRTLTKDSGNRSGQFGMGFVAIFLLTGWSAALELHTHSRLDGEDPISAVINNRGITIDHEERLDDRMEDDEYGTKLKLILKDDISKEDMRKWIRKNGEYARTPVIYQELDADGVEQYRREFGMKKLEAEFDPDAPTIVFEDEFVRAVMSPDADGRTLNLDVPIRRGYTRNGSLPWSFDIRLKNENQPIVQSPEEDEIGVFYTERGEYEDMDESRQELYTYESHSDAIVMAGVSGTRDTLKRAKDFWKKYVFTNLQEEYKTKVRRVFMQLDDPAALSNLTSTELTLAKQAVSDCISNWVDSFNMNRSKSDYTASQLIDDVESEFSIGLDEDIARLLVALKSEVNVVSHNHPVTDQPDSEFQYPEGCGTKEAGMVAEETDGRIFMGVSLNQKKADVVWNDSDSNRVIELDSASDYDVFESALGWERLADVTSQTIDDFDIGEDLRSEFEENVGSTEETCTEDTEVTLTYRTLRNKQGRGYGREWRIQRKNRNARAIRNDFKEYRVSGERPSYGSYTKKCLPRVLVLFPESSEANISDYYWLGSNDFALAKVSDDVAEYLTWEDSIVTIDEYIETAENYTLETSDGYWSTGVSTNRLVFHLMTDSVAARFRQPDVLEGMPETLAQMHNDEPHKWPRDITTYNIVYAPITREDLVYTRYHLRDETDSFLIMGDVEFHGESSNRLKLTSDTRMYAQSAMREIDTAPTEVEEFFNSVEADLSSGGLTVVDALVEHYKT